jgi:methenyltetrahydrofolate cyclohydrolase
MVLETTARKPAAEDVKQSLAELAQTADREAERLRQLAHDDGAAYGAYMRARKQKSAHVQAALRQAIETPLAAARSALSGIDLCVAARSFTRGAIAADVCGAAVLLEGAVRAILLTIDTNLRAVEDEAFARTVTTERHTLAEHAQSQMGKVLNG